MSIAVKSLPGNRVASVDLLTFGRARINLGIAGDEWSYTDNW